ncbi:MFS general substrate transporter [Ceraceosorus guamensis]|uniref:MFS general substrate transporter n=1 Tax=Ceraceosorus guamensis TaxID=1522189 RepID=A0A316VR18_9BASI|nr:MFS general substrate transporter [Ceraceosorus guamensis]PWN39962.1 MFS general substrate transporter [Ceraceosorus guamensis]
MSLSRSSSTSSRRGRQGAVSISRHVPDSSVSPTRTAASPSRDASPNGGSTTVNSLYHLQSSNLKEKLDQPHDDAPPGVTFADVNDEQIRRSPDAVEDAVGSQLEDGANDVKTESSDGGLPARKKRNPHLVSFEYLDKEDPRNLGIWRKWSILGIAFALETWANVASSMVAPGIEGMADDLNVSVTKARVTQAVFLYGFAVGAVVTTPVSEDYGRRPTVFGFSLLLAIFQIPCALAPNFATVVAFRLLSGFVASVAFTSVGVINDLFEADNQGWAVNTFAISAEAGAVIGPVIGGYLFEAAGWRWIFGLLGLVQALLIVLYFFGVPETRAGIILAKRAKRKRSETGDDRWFAKHEEDRKAHTAAVLIRETVTRPLFMLFTEPIVFWFALFDGFNYAIVYLFLEAFALIYGQYNFSIGAQGLPFLGVLVGFLIAYFGYPTQMAYERRSRSRNDGVLLPEARLAWSLPGGVLFAGSLFWFAWTSIPSIHWIVPTLAAGLFGVSSHIIFIAVSDYTIDAYGPFAASAVGAQSLLREILSGSVTLVAEPMYHNLGYQWASSLLGFIAVLLAFVPPILFWFGSSIRKRSSFAQEIAAAEEHAKREAQIAKMVYTRSLSIAPQA